MIENESTDPGSVAGGTELLQHASCRRRVDATAYPIIYLVIRAWHSKLKYDALIEHKEVANGKN